MSKKYLIIKSFWKSVKPFFSNKGLNSKNIFLLKENEIVDEDGKIAAILNKYFTNITKHMNLKANKRREELVNKIDTFKNHKSVQRIKLLNFHFKSTLNFSKVTESEVRKKILNLSLRRQLKTVIIQPTFLTKVPTYHLLHLYFKKKISQHIATNVSILPHMSKVFERILYKQIDTSMTIKLFPWISDFRKNQNAQYLLNLEKAFG